MVTIVQWIKEDTLKMLFILPNLEMRRFLLPLTSITNLEEHMWDLVSTSTATATNPE